MFQAISLCISNIDWVVRADRRDEVVTNRLVRICVIFLNCIAPVTPVNKMV